MVIFVAVAGGTIWALGYLIACAIWPYTSCRKCGGGGRFKSPTGRAWRHCRKCKGSGARVRLGRRAWTALAKVKKAAID